MDKITNWGEPDHSVQSEFRKSWDRIEKFYGDIPMRTFLGDPLTDLMVQLVRAMAQAGYDQRLRAGQMCHQLVLSRSREHGDLGRCYVRFVPEYGSYKINGISKIAQSLKVSYSVDDALAEEFEEDEIALTDRIHSLLQRLSEQPIT